MARTIPSAFVPIDYEETGTTRPIDDTEATMVKNVNYLYASHRGAIIRTTFRDRNQQYVAGRNPASAAVNALWCIEPPGEPFDFWSIYILVENTSSTDAATVRFDLASDPYPGTYTDISVAPSVSQWTQVGGVLATDNTQTTDTIRMWAINGASGAVNVHSVMIVPRVATSIAAGVNTRNGWDFVPVDDDEVDQDAPLSVRIRRREHENMMHIWRNRPGSVIGWSDDTHHRAGAEAFSTTESSFVEVLRFPVFLPRGTTDLRWAVFLRKTGSGTGKMRLRTKSMDEYGEPAVEVDAVNSWSSPYTSNLHKYDDVGQDSLPVTTDPDFETTQDEVVVELRSDGANTVYLYGITMWAESVQG